MVQSFGKSLTSTILAHQSLTNSVNKKGSGKMLSITLLPIAGLVLLLGSGKCLGNLMLGKSLRN